LTLRAVGCGHTTSNQVLHATARRRANTSVVMPTAPTKLTPVRSQTNPLAPRRRAAPSAWEGWTVVAISTSPVAETTTDEPMARSLRPRPAEQ
jgi:hypothetical protein